MRTLVWIIAGMSVTALPYAMLLHVFARDELGMGAPGLGSMLAATGTGALLSGMALASGRRRLPGGRLNIGAGVVLVLIGGPVLRHTRPRTAVGRKPVDRGQDRAPPPIVTRAQIA